MQALQEKMSEPRRQHPVAAVTSALDVVKRNIITLIIIFWVGSRGNNSYTHIIIISITFVALLVWGIIYWQRFTYYVSKGTLIIKYGVIVQKNLSLSRDRIQVIDITSGPVQRAFGLVSVQVKTAGSTSEDAFISAVTFKEAENLKALLQKEKSSSGIEDETQAKKVQKSIKLPQMDLIKASCTSGSIGIIFPILGGIFSQIELLVPDQEIFSFISEWVPETGNFWVVLILMTILLAWGLAFIFTYITLYNFTLTLTEDQLVIKKGLFEQKQLTLPYNRIQALNIHESMLREPFGLATVYVESAGYGEEGRRSTTLFPLIAENKVKYLIREVLPEYDVAPDLEKPPSRAMFRYLRRTLLPVLLIVILAIIFLPYGYLTSILVIPALALGLARFKSAAFGHTEDTLMLKFRIFGLTTAFIKNFRIQDISVAQNIFQKRVDLGHLITHVASGREGKRFIIHDLDHGNAEEVWSWASPSFSGRKS